MEKVQLTLLRDTATWMHAVLGNGLDARAVHGVPGGAAALPAPPSETLEG